MVHLNDHRDSFIWMANKKNSVKNMYNDLVLKSETLVNIGRGKLTLVERVALVRAFSPSSTLEPGLTAFCRRGPKCSLETPPL
jgi:hypothetical protein